MALSINNDPTDTCSMVSGAWANQTAPEFLGLKDLSLLMPLPAGGGSIAIGFDTRISPAQVRIFFDPGNLPVPGTGLEKTYGLVMTSQIRFDGLPVLPGVFSDSIAFMDDYTPLPLGKRGSGGYVQPLPGFSVNMKSKGSLASLFNAKKQFNNDPYYAYNSLDAPTATLSDAFDIANPNGFLAVQPYADTGTTPCCASLFAPLGIDIDGPLQHTISAMQSTFETTGPVYASFPATPGGNLLQKAMTALNIPGPEVIKVQMFGNAPLITLNDDENYYPFLLVPENEIMGNNNIYFLEVNTINSIRYGLSSGLFERFIDFANEKGFYSEAYPQRPGIYTRSYNKLPEKAMQTMLSGGPHIISIDYKVYCVGYGTDTGSTSQIYSCMAGVEWKAQRWFDKNTFNFGPMQIIQPQILSMNDIANYNLELEKIGTNSAARSSLPELSEYINASIASRTKHTPGQDQWFNAPAPLPPGVNNLAVGNNTVFSPS